MENHLRFGSEGTLGFSRLQMAVSMGKEENKTQAGQFWQI